MDVNSKEIEELVKKVLSELNGTKAPERRTSNQAIPTKAHVAYLTALEKFEVKEVDVPPVGDDDILVKVEGCGICGTDAHEFRKDPFSLIPVVLGKSIFKASICL